MKILFVMCRVFLVAMKYYNEHPEQNEQWRIFAFALQSTNNSPQKTNSESPGLLSEWRPTF